MKLVIFVLSLASLLYFMQYIELTYQCEETLLLRETEEKNGIQFSIVTILRISYKVDFI